MTDLVPYWVSVCRLLGVDPTTLPMPELIFASGKGPYYLPSTHTVYLPEDRPVRVGELVHELTHAVMCKGTGFNTDRSFLEERGQWVETQTEDAQELLP